MDKLQSLYGSWEVPTDEGNAFRREASSLLTPLFERAVVKNIRLRDLANTLTSVVGELESYYNLKRNSEAYKRGERPSEDSLSRRALHQPDFFSRGWDGHRRRVSEG